MTDGIRWRYVLFSVLLYLLLVIALGALLINALGEPIGPISDLVITSLLVMIISHIGAERSYEGESSFQGMVIGMITGIGCAMGQSILALIVGRLTLISLGLTLVSYTLAGLLAGATGIRR